MNPHGMEVYGTVKVGDRGQIVIPSGARKRLGIRAGDFMLVVSTPQGDGIALIKADVVREMVRKMSIGLSQTEEARPRTRAKKA
ncbi:MAG: AbrB/MazE/SpoVT family DNA-binding domain-containing protein [Thermoplasmata archaeon]|nr:AbrB/MazE/SpoVT family DNA-binding domain-containing protein [Thermoplasmata archaeon]